MENGAIIDDIILYIPPILLIILVTYWLMNSNNKKIICFSLINFLIFIFCAFLVFRSTGEIKNTNYMKYPFRIYYLSYAFFISSILIIVFRNEKITNLCYNKIVEFISKSSLWIYLWHIFFLAIIKEINLNWIIKYITVLVFSIIITYLQNKLIDKLEKHNVSNNILGFFRG